MNMNHSSLWHDVMYWPRLLLTGAYVARVSMHVRNKRVCWELVRARYCLSSPIKIPAFLIYSRALLSKCPNKLAVAHQQIDRSFAIFCHVFQTGSSMFLIVPLFVKLQEGVAKLTSHKKTHCCFLYRTEKRR